MVRPLPLLFLLALLALSSLAAGPLPHASPSIGSASDDTSAAGTTTGTAPAPLIAAPSVLPPGSRVVVVVRHGETAADGSGDPPLSAAGIQRGLVLARIAASYDVEAAFATPFKRTRGTAERAAEWLGLRVEAVPIPAAGVSAHVADLVARVRAAPGPGVLVVGHSNTVPAVVLALTGVDIGPIAETEYSRLFVVVLPAEGTPTVEERSY
jgi:broad specificity phosphatase PhoE